ncbi:MULTISPECIES: hypothetical protein [Bacillus cereus group]|uniref:Lipoprotein n=1 Tax=Bacillus cereus TaxID=1396 RepID=A0A9W7UXD1_BACCE|nr:hypothetical protein [Bacillus cereus]KAB2397081.1 hypothetical protein F8172_11550 [Bacillus cereus]KAB2408072.1 hypothetical protein F8170_09970 [Bacillus cereus]KAB2430881.1 hypothetical protein F8168_06695 [Bacillus cereus]
MKKYIIAFIILILSFSLFGCSTNKVNKTKEKTDSNGDVIVFNDKKVKEINIISNNETKNIKNFRKIKTIIDAINNSEQKSLFVDKDALKNVNNNLQIRFQENEQQEFHMWITSNNTEITLVENKESNESKKIGYQLHKTDSKKILDLLQ